MTATMTTIFVGERLGVFGWGGIVMLAAGVLLLSLRGGRDLAKLDRVAVGFALFTAVTVAAYSVVDGIGARAAGPGKATAYSTVLFVGIAPVVVAYALIRRGIPVFRQMAPFWLTGLGGGALAVISYSIAIWAMTVAPIAIVAALRETSVLFGALIAVVILKEPLRPARIVAALMIVCGLMLLRVA
jgi:drug/metabolite transporter (DMT)-like permease